MIEAKLIDSMGSDLSVVNAARVSFGKKSEWEETFEDCDKSLLRLSDRDTKLIKYLAKHKHLSPFGHAFASFHVKAPIFVGRQLVKHKFLRWNEVSRRYVDDEPEFYTPDVWRGKAEDVKQGSSGEAALASKGYFYYEYKEDDSEVPYKYQCGVDTPLKDVIDDYNQRALTLYTDMVDRLIAPEQARMVLPQSTMTEWYWSGSLDAFAAMCRLRCAPDTQLESRIAADDISAQMSKLFPVSWAALLGEN
jgi:thymidylate synthase (FAD)